MVVLLAVCACPRVLDAIGESRKARPKNAASQSKLGNRWTRRPVRLLLPERPDTPGHTKGRSGKAAFHPGSACARFALIRFNSYARVAAPSFHPSEEPNMDGRPALFVCRGPSLTQQTNAGTAKIIRSVHMFAGVIQYSIPAFRAVRRTYRCRLNLPIQNLSALLGKVECIHCLDE
jgi:hypothetical protein